MRSGLYNYTTAPELGGGNVPLGYDVKDRKLTVNETEAATVRLIFRRYAELGSVALLKAELDRLGQERKEGKQRWLPRSSNFVGELDIRIRLADIDPHVETIRCSNR
jgi:hypothetical protein